MKKHKPLGIKLGTIIKDAESESKGAKESANLNNLLSTDNSANPVLNHAQIGLNYYNKGEYDKAIENFKKALHLEGGSAQIHYNLGLTYQAKGLLDEAEEEYKKSLELNPLDKEAHNNLGIIYYSLGKNNEAATEFKEALRIDSNFKLARKNLEKIVFRGDHG